jgi:hypothetical protein
VLKESISKERAFGFKLHLSLWDFMVDYQPNYIDNWEFDRYPFGLVISIHNQSEDPFANNIEHIKLKPFSKTDILINRNFITKLADYNGNCLDDKSENSKFNSPYFDYIVKELRLDYSHKHCNNLCLQDQFIKHCECASIKYPIFLNTTRFCTDVDRDFFSNCMIGVISNFTEYCIKLCPSECSYIEYETKLVPNYQLTDTAKFNRKDIDEMNVSVNIYYENLEYTRIEEIALMGPLDLLSNIGGILGIFLGMSIHFV